MKFFGVIFVTDFRFPGGTSTAVASELRALQNSGITVALCQVDAPLFRKKGYHYHPEIASLIEEYDIPVLDVSEAAEADLLVIHNPLVMTRPLAVKPKLKAKLRIVVAHTPPADGRGFLNYDAWRVDAICRSAFGEPVMWAPISPICRASFEKAGVSLPCLAEDWTNVIFIDDWSTPREETLGQRPVIGRHGRSAWQKWPETRETILKIYPDRQDVPVRLLGVGGDLERVMGHYPSNWVTWAFNDIPVNEFLKKIDFFVYYHHPQWVEAFGRTVAEAASAGCVCILPPHFEPTFKEAALYAEPDEAMPLIERIASDPSAFAAQSMRGRQAIDRDYGPKRYLERIATCLAAARNGTGERLVYVPAPKGFLNRASRRYAYHAYEPIRKPLRKLRRKIASVKAALPAG